MIIIRLWHFQRMRRCICRKIHYRAKEPETVRRLCVRNLRRLAVEPLQLSQAVPFVLFQAVTHIIRDPGVKSLIRALQNIDSP